MLTRLATITQKGQVTIPKVMRDKLNIALKSRVLVSITSRSVQIKRAGPTIFELAGKFKIPKDMPGILEAREQMEKNYSRF